MPNFTMPVSEFMTAPVYTIAETASLAEAHERLQTLAVSSLAITGDDGALAGVISRTDLLRTGRYQAGTRKEAALLTLPDHPVSEIMTREVIAVRPEDPVEQASRFMIRNYIHRVFVCDNSALAGVFSTRDVMDVIRDKRLNVAISEHMSRPLFLVRAHEPISLAAERLEKARVTGLVVTENDWPVGVFTQTEALMARDLPRDTPIEEAMNSAIVCMPIDTPMHRAAEQALAMRVRRIIACDKRDAVGILTGIDFARATA